MCYGSGATSEYRLGIGVFEGVGQFGSKFQVERDISAPTILRVGKLDIIAKLTFHCGIRICAEVSFVLSQFTRLTDRRTDSRTALPKMLHFVCTCNQ